jgi:hypothetical protein
MTFKTDLIDGDLDIMLANDEFGVDVTFGAATILGIFDDSNSVVSLDNEGIEATAPQVIVKTSDVTTLTHSSTLIINAVTYYILSIQPDGTGLTTVILSKEAT